MNSLILRGYGQYDRIITRGYGRGWLGIIRTEWLRFKTTITRTIARATTRDGVVNG